jgi:hypothetical protein
MLEDVTRSIGWFYWLDCVCLYQTLPSFNKHFSLGDFERLRREYVQTYARGYIIPWDEWSSAPMDAVYF